MRASALFLMGSIAVLLLGLFNSFLAQASPIRMATDTPLLALARLHYLFWGVGIFVLGALIHVPGADCARRESASKLGFWLMFLGFNLAFFPTTLRRSQAFLEDPTRLFSPAVSPEVFVGALMFVAGVGMCLWNCAQTARSSSA